MTDDICEAFAEITALLEDMHAFAVDGQSRHNSADMQRVLLCHLRQGVASLQRTMAGIRRQLAADDAGSTP